MDPTQGFELLSTILALLSTEPHTEAANKMVEMLEHLISINGNSYYVKALIQSKVYFSIKCANSMRLELL